MTERHPALLTREEAHQVMVNAPNKPELYLIVADEGARKVVEWLDEHNCQTRGLVLTTADWQALRETVGLGEEKP